MIKKEEISNGVKKNIAILFPLIKSGGVFQYANSIADSLIKYCDKFNYFILHYGDADDFIKDKKAQLVLLDGTSNSIFDKIRTLLGRPSNKNKELLNSFNLDLIIIPCPLLLGLECKIPYIVSVPDIMHKYYPKFPEYSFKERVKRDIIYKYSTRHSAFNVVDSKQGLEDLHKFYNVPRERIKTIPYIPSGSIYNYKEMSKERAGEIIKKFNFNEKFLFYPAQFWYHKNHIRLVRALKLIEDDIQLVLVGNAEADKENYNKVMAIGGNIKHLGYVSDEEIAALYKKATALVFPTLIGPTSIPPLEAMVFGAPVLCSNLFSMPEQIGDAGVLFNPFDEKDIAEKIKMVWRDEELRERLTNNGYNKIKKLSLKNHSLQWEEVIDKILDNYGKY